MVMLILYYLNSNITPPTTYRELLIVITAPYTYTVGVSIILPKDAIMSATQHFDSGSSQSGSNVILRIAVSNTSIALNTANVNGNTYNSTATVKVYYR